MSAIVLAVHSIDTEGPLGGNARRLPDGSAEFMDNWDDILVSLRELTADEFRQQHADSFGGPYRFNWFVMDFTGFRTNPKCRVAEYHDTWDHIASLPVRCDGRYWHYHVPPVDGVGDHWSESWLSSNECNTVLVRRLLERQSFPAAFRAGGTIEDEPASRWLEQTIPIDYSNRASERSQPGADLYHFNWYGAPQVWSSYHPALGDPMREGQMRRFVYRCTDLRSRYNELTYEQVEACFREAQDGDAPRVLSYFSHDNRDMRSETYHVAELLTRAARNTGVPWASCTAVEAHQRMHRMKPEPIDLSIVRDADGYLIRASRAPFQLSPFVGARLRQGRFVRLYPKPLASTEWRLAIAGDDVEQLGAAVTSVAGDVALAFA